MSDADFVADAARQLAPAAQFCDCAVQQMRERRMNLTTPDGAGATRKPDPPWIFRTYAGHSSAAESNRLFRDNLARGQTWLSIDFDLPTQTGYDSDNPM